MVTHTQMAFPDPKRGSEQSVMDCDQGMNLRTWIATHALQGILANPYSNDITVDLHVTTAIKAADYLIEQLNKPINNTP